MKQGTLRRGGLIRAALLLTACGGGEAVAAVTPSLRWSIRPRVGQPRLLRQ